MSSSWTLWQRYFDTRTNKKIVFMTLFFTAPDVVWIEDERKGAYHIATIYTVEADISGIDPVERITQERVIRVLNDAPVIERRYVPRLKWKSHSWIELMSLLRTIPGSAHEISRDNSSNRQHIWSGDGKITDIRGIMWRSEEIQYPPFGEYFTSTDALLDALERSWRKLDTGSISHGFPAKMHHFYIDD